MESPLLNKSLEFATQIVLFYEEYAKSKRDTTIAKQLLRSARVSVQISMKQFMETANQILLLNYIFH